MHILKLEPLTQETFAPFGDVIETDGRAWIPINQGSTRRYHDLGSVQVLGDGARAGISLAVGNAFNYPLRVGMLERHPLGSQSWIPTNRVSFIAVVAPNGADDAPDEAGLRAFHVQGIQGVNYHAGTWHHPLLTLGMPGEFIVVDRVGDQPNCDERTLRREYCIDGSYREACVVQS